MRPILTMLGLVVVVGMIAGCDEASLSNLSPALQAALSNNAAAKLTSFAEPLQTQDRLQDRLHDGSCEGDGNQYQNGGNGGAGDGNGNGGGDQIQQQLRDGSCNDG